MSAIVGGSRTEEATQGRSYSTDIALQPQSSMLPFSAQLHATVHGRVIGGQQRCHKRGGNNHAGTANVGVQFVPAPSSTRGKVGSFRRASLSQHPCSGVKRDTSASSTRSSGSWYSNSSGWRLEKKELVAAASANHGLRWRTAARGRGTPRTCATSWSVTTRRQAPARPAVLQNRVGLLSHSLLQALGFAPTTAKPAH